MQAMENMVKSCLKSGLRSRGRLSAASEQGGDRSGRGPAELGDALLRDQFGSPAGAAIERVHVGCGKAGGSEAAERVLREEAVGAAGDLGDCDVLQCKVAV